MLGAYVSDLLLIRGLYGVGVGRVPVGIRRFGSIYAEPMGLSVTLHKPHKIGIAKS